MKIAKKLLAILLLLVLVFSVLTPPGTAWAAEDDEDEDSGGGINFSALFDRLFAGLDNYRKDESDDNSAAGDVQWYVNNSGILENRSIIHDAMRSIGFGLTKLLCNAANAVETLYDKTFGMIDITQYPKINDLLTQLRPVLVALTCLCLIGLGATMIVTQQKVPLVRNILLGALVICASGWIFSTANELVSDFKSGVLGDDDVNQSYAIVNDNIIDLVALDKNGNIGNLNYAEGKGIVYGVGAEDKEDLNAIDINEVLDWCSKKNGMKLYGWSKTFNNKIKFRAVQIGKNNWTTTENYDGLTKANIGNEFYYRYSFDFWCCSLQLIGLVLLFAALAYKNVRIAYELVVSRILAYMYAADVGNGERLKNILFFVRDTYITLAVSVLCVKLYAIFNAAIISFGITGLSKGIASVFIAYAVIDGPNLVERLLGMDAGLSSSLARTAAMFGLAKGAAKLGVSAVKGAAGVAKKGIDKMKVGAAEDGGKTEQGGHSRASGKNSSGSGTATAAAMSQSMEEKQGKSFDPSFMEEKRAESGTAAPMGGKASGTQRTGGNSRSGSSAAGTQTEQFSRAMHSSSSNSGGGKNAASQSGKTVRAAPSASTAAKTQRVSNPAFSDAVRRLTPPQTASAAERKDFNRQMNAIVRTKKHAPIQPAPDAPDYEKRNYEKGLELAAAYRSYQPQQPAPSPEPKQEQAQDVSKPTAADEPEQKEDTDNGE